MEATTKSPAKSPAKSPRTAVAASPSKQQRNQQQQQKRSPLKHPSPGSPKSATSSSKKQRVETKSPSAPSSPRANEASAPPPSPSQGGKYDCDVIVYNVAKKHNVGTICRSAVAFGASRIHIIGKKKVSTFGHQGTRDFIHFCYYDRIEEAVEWLKKKNFSIIGVEIDSTAKSVVEHPFSGHTAFMLGNEGQGLNEKQLRLCDSLVYIPQYGKGTASLNVACAASIILHHFSVWAKYNETSREGQKFVVDAEEKVNQPRHHHNQKQQEQKELQHKQETG